VAAGGDASADDWALADDVLSSDNVKTVASHAAHVADLRSLELECIASSSSTFRARQRTIRDVRAFP
jgi:hypothetical protein